MSYMYCSKLEILGFILYPFSFFLYSPFKLKKKHKIRSPTRPLLIDKIDLLFDPVTFDYLLNKV